VSVPSCQHSFTFKGAVQIYVRGQLDGIVDVFACPNCGSSDVIVKRPGHVSLGTFGFEPTRGGQRRFILVCRGEGRLGWQTLVVEPPTTIVHDCPALGRSSAVKVAADEKVDDDLGAQHRLIPILESVNQSLQLA
jgi:hypothetical protein